MELNNLPMSHRLLAKAMHIFKTIRDKIKLAEVYASFSKLFVARREPGKAIAFARDALLIAKKLESQGAGGYFSAGAGDRLLQFCS